MAVPTVRMGISLTLLSALETLFSCWVVLFSINRRTFAVSYFSLFCSIWLLSLGGLLFSEERGRVALGERDVKRELGGVWGAVVGMRRI